MIEHLFEGLEIETKKCSICKEIKPISNFGKEGKGKNGYRRYECRSCAHENARIIKEIRKTAPLVPIDHKCPICLRSAEELPTYGKKKKSPWVLDHDHKTNVFRGWLCQKCNMGLGNLAEDIGRLNRAKQYLGGTKLLMTEDLISKLNNAAKYWNECLYNPSENSDKIEKYFDCWCNEIYGINVTVEEHSTTVGHRWIQWNKVEVLDEEKYTWFLLRF